MYFLGEIGGVPILLIRIILGILISILFVITPNHHLYPFFLTPFSFIIGLMFVSYLLGWTRLVTMVEVAPVSPIVVFPFCSCCF